MLLQVHDDPDIETNVSPDGMVSVTVTGSTVGPFPVLVTKRVYVAFCWPWAKLPVCELVIPSTAGPVELVTGKTAPALGLQPPVTAFRTVSW